MSAPSLGAFSSLVVQHQAKNEPESIRLDVRSSQIARGLEPSDDLAFEIGGLPNVYLSDRSRKPSALSRRDTFADDEPKLNDVVTGEIIADHTPADNRGPSSVNSRSRSSRQKKADWMQFCAICWCIYAVGWHDGSYGALLPRIQQEYKLSFTAVSTVFVSSCFGYICGAGLNIWLNEKLGFGKTIVLGAVCQLVSYIFIIPALSFPVFISAYCLAGFGLSLQAAQSNGYVGSLLDNMNIKMGVMHGSYGLGAFTSPFASTYFAKFSRPYWSFHYIISAFLTLMSIIILILVFRFKRQEEVLLEIGQEHIPETTPPEGNIYRQIVRIKSIHLMTIFSVIYIGVEVTLGGWIVTFIIRERHGGGNSGYISSGFWGGLTLGRVALIWFNKYIGEYRVIFIYSFIAIGLELTIWFIPSIIENAIAVSFVGLVLGPMFPLLVQHMTRVLPRWLLTGSVGLVTGIGIAGSAALPFTTGLLSQKFGIFALQPLIISMLVTQIFVWVFVPRGRRVD